MSDLPGPELVELAAELERFVAVMRMATSIEDLEPTRTTRIVAFASAEDFVRFRALESAAGVFLRTRDLSLMQFYAAEAASWRREVLFHEFAHHLMSNAHRSAHPPWYEEGMAELLGTVTWRDDAISIGMVPRLARSALQSGQWIPVEELLGTTSFNASGHALGVQFYGQSWGLVHYLHVSGNDRRQRMQHFLELQASGVPWRKAFDRAFEISVDDLDSELRDHWKSLRTRVRFLNLWAGDLEENTDWEVVSLPPARAADVLAELAWNFKGVDGIPLVLGLARAGLKHESGDPRLLAFRARALLARGDVDEAEAALSQADMSPVANALVAETRGDLLLRRASDDAEANAAALGEAARTAYRQAQELAPDRVEPLLKFAASFSDETLGGDAEEGLAAFEALAERTDWTMDLELALGLVKLRADREPEARLHLGNVIRFADGTKEAEIARNKLEELDAAGGDESLEE